jgi:hypothetical protein
MCPERAGIPLKNFHENSIPVQITVQARPAYSQARFLNVFFLPPAACKLEFL